MPTRSGYPRGGLHGQIVHEIGRKIVSGAIRPGDPLPLPDLSASRTVLREVVKVLAAKGLVESRPKVGTRVRPQEAWNLLDPDVLAWQQEETSSADFLRKLTEVRQAVEPAAAQLAAQRAGPDELRVIEEAYRDMEVALTGRLEDLDAFNLADMRFHRGIVAACGNELLGQMSQFVFTALQVSFEATSRLPGRAKAALPDHRAVLDAIRRRHVKKAGAAMRYLVQTTAREIEGLSAPPGVRKGLRR